MPFLLAATASWTTAGLWIGLPAVIVVGITTAMVALTLLVTRPTGELLGQFIPSRGIDIA